MHLSRICTVTRSGFSLLELLIVTAVLSTVVYITAQTLNTGSQIHDQLIDTTLSSADAGRIVHDIAMELRGSRESLITTYVDAVTPYTVTYQQCRKISRHTGQPIYTPEDHLIDDLLDNPGAILDISDYDNSSYITLSYDPNTDTLERIEGSGADEYVTALATNVTNFSIDDNVTSSYSTVNRRRINIIMEITANTEEDIKDSNGNTLEDIYGDNIATEISRTVFIRGHLYDSSSNSGSDGQDDSGDPNIVSQPSGDNPPTLIWDPPVITGDQFELTITVNAEGDETFDISGMPRTPEDIDGITISFEEGANFTSALVSATDTSVKYTVSGTISGSTYVGVEAATITGTSRGRPIIGSSITETNYF